MDLRDRLVEACRQSLDPFMLGAVEKKLKENGGKTPFKIFVEFSLSEDGELEASFTSKFEIGSTPKKMEVKADGKQMPLPEPETLIPERDRPTQGPSKSQLRRLQSQIGAGGEGRAEARLAEIKQRNIQLFRDGVITKDQALQAGLTEAELS